MKPRVLVCVLTGTERTNWLCPDLAQQLITVMQDSRFETAYYPVRDARPWEIARNVAVHMAREWKADWLLSFDNDNFAYGNPLDVIAQAGKDQRVIGLSYGQVANGEMFRIPREQGQMSSEFFQDVPLVGGGVLMIHRAVWEKIAGPYFCHVFSKPERTSGEGVTGEDKYFCELVRKRSFRVWTHKTILAGHYKTVDVTQVIHAFNGVKNGR